MTSLRSADGTLIAFDVAGEGDPIVFVAGAFNERATCAPLAAALQDDFRTVVYDRRGRGGSGDSSEYDPEREVEDLAALIDEVGGRAAVFGYSSGAVLSLLAAGSGLAIPRLALYEPPTPGEGRGPEFWLELRREIDAAIAVGDPGAAVELFQTRAVGIPESVVAQLRQAPFWPALEAIAPTLSYEAAILGTPPERAADVLNETLVMLGGESNAYLRGAAESVVRMLPNGSLEVIEGVAHDLVPESIAPVLSEFLA